VLLLKLSDTRRDALNAWLDGRRVLTLPQREPCTDVCAPCIGNSKLSV
jgi:hypothetical protein